MFVCMCYVCNVVVTSVRAAASRCSSYVRVRVSDMHASDSVFGRVMYVCMYI